MIEWMSEVCGQWEPPQTKAKSICSFDLFFLCRLAGHLGGRVTEFGCGATTVEMCRLGYDVETFSVDISEAAKKADLTAKFNKCDVTDPEWLDRIIESARGADLLAIDALHTYGFAQYYSEKIFPHINCPVWIHDYWNDKYIPYGEQRYLDANVIGKTHRIKALTDLPKAKIKELSNLVGVDIMQQRHPRPLTKNTGPRLCSVVLEKK